MIHAWKNTSDDTLQKSFERKQIWLKDCYGKPVEYHVDKQYPENIWDVERFMIKHFIKDRFGDEEGILFLFETFNSVK